MATISKENYLKAIYMLSEGNGKLISTTNLANELQVSKAAISEMANRLADQGFIDYKKYKGIKILSKGRKVAISVIRKHRLWELFLIKTLGLSWGEVHNEAERLEHCTTEILIDRIDEYLNYPEIDPHGEPIPNKNGDYRSNWNDISMKDSKVNQLYSIVRVNDRSDELMNYLSKLNISLNKEITIIEKLNFDGSQIIEIENTKHTFSEKIIENIFLREIKN